MRARMGYEVVRDLRGEVVCDLKRPISSYGQELCLVCTLERCEIGQTRHDVECEVEHLVKFHHLDLVDFSHMPSV